MGNPMPAFIVKRIHRIEAITEFQMLLKMQHTTKVVPRVQHRCGMIPMKPKMTTEMENVVTMEVKLMLEQQTDQKMGSALLISQWVNVRYLCEHLLD